MTQDGLVECIETSQDAVAFGSVFVLSKAMLSLMAQVDSSHLCASLTCDPSFRCVRR